MLDTIQKNSFVGCARKLSLKSLEKIAKALKFGSRDLEKIFESKEIAYTRKKFHIIEKWCKGFKKKSGSKERGQNNSGKTATH